MREYWKKFKEIFKKHYIWILPALTALLLFVAVGIPFISNKLAFDGMLLESSGRITLVRYAGEPFQSSVDWIRESEDQQANQNFVKLIREGKAYLYKEGQPGSDVLFFHLDDGSVLTAFVDTGRLGLQYGKVWVEVEDWSAFYDSMTQVELVDVKDLEEESEQEQ